MIMLMMSLHSRGCAVEQLVCPTHDVGVPKWYGLQGLIIIIIIM
jgi:hypothetical protein